MLLDCCLKQQSPCDDVLAIDPTPRHHLGCKTICYNVAAYFDSESKEGILKADLPPGELPFPPPIFPSNRWGGCAEGSCKAAKSHAFAVRITHFKRHTTDISC